MDLRTVASASLMDVVPYQPGITAERLRREHGLETVYKFSSNELPYPPAPGVLHAMRSAATVCNRYPDYHDLLEAIAGFYALESANIIIGNGSIDIIELAVRMVARPGKNLVLSSHGYSAFPLLAKVCGLQIRKADSNEQYGHQAGMIVAACNSETAAIVLDSPANMSGQSLTLFEIERVLSAIPDHTLLILDQAYIEFCDNGPAAGYLNLIKKYPNLLITRTFSKAYGLAGLRVGYGISNPEVISWLYKLQRPFPVAGVAVAAAGAALADQAHLDRVKQEIRTEKAILCRALEELGITVLSGAGNFVLIEPGKEMGNLFAELLKNGFITRPLSAYGRPDLLRISIGLKDELGQLIHKIREIKQRH